MKKKLIILQLVILNSVVFGSIQDGYTIGVEKDFAIKPITNDTTKALQGVVGFTAEFYGDGEVTNYQAVSKGVVA
jgi:hypothetical protein